MYRGKQERLEHLGIQQKSLNVPASPESVVSVRKEELHAKWAEVHIQNWLLHHELAPSFKSF